MHYFLLLRIENNDGNLHTSSHMVRRVGREWEGEWEGVGREWEESGKEREGEWEESGKERGCGGWFVYVRKRW